MAANLIQQQQQQSNGSGSEAQSGLGQSASNSNCGNNNNNSDSLDNSTNSQSLLAADGGNQKLNFIKYHQFQSPQADKSLTIPKNMQPVPNFKNEIAPDLSQPANQQQPKLEKECENLKEKIDKFEERIEALNKLLVRSKESRLNNKVNEIQEELCQKRFDLLVAQIHLSAVRSQLQLFEYNYRPHNQQQLTNLLATAAAAASGDVGGADFSADLANQGANPSSGSGSLSRKTSSNANSAQQQQQQQMQLHSGLMPTGGSNNNSSMNLSQQLGYRNKWIKAFKSLKESPSSSSSR